MRHLLAKRKTPLETQEVHATMVGRAIEGPPYKKHTCEHNLANDPKTTDGVRKAE